MYHVVITNRNYRDGDELLRDTYIEVDQFETWEAAADLANNISNTLPPKCHVGIAGLTSSLSLQVTDMAPGLGYDFTASYSQGYPVRRA